MNKKIGILVIHGIGQQGPFETLDAFAKPFSNLYCGLSQTEMPSAVVHKKHELAKFPEWIDSCVSLKSDQNEIDIYEYYWAHLTQREITVVEVIDWLFSVAKGADAFYKRQKSMKNSEKNDALFSADGEFNGLKYLVKILALGNLLKFPILFSSQFFSSPVKHLIGKVLEGPLVDTFGDVALYSSSDKKSKYFEVRKKILNGAVEKLKFLLQSDMYENVILVGHSLGTVIAYDALARINKEMNIDVGLRKKATKIDGFVTFGSPLDKIAFFFADKINQENQPMRYAITSQLHGFKKVNIDTEELENGVEDYFEHVKWLNFWSKMDPVSGHLDVYRDLKNIEMDFSKMTTNPIKTHSLYWESEDMYKHIISEYNLFS